MITPLSTATPRSTATPLSTAADAIEIFADVDSCGVCPHGAALHDRVAQRFCAATLSGALTRGCICAKTG
ncbi:RGCVC family protein [uncultured Jatrophihabitans sp.]|uniref:RGCVC family protein n=1 Tax=uncultured Jatrophihabitans sp. TaxID=1610747 RepID=UPI0035CC2EBD